jgi:hypothetical protein
VRQNVETEALAHQEVSFPCYFSEFSEENIREGEKPLKKELFFESSPEAVMLMVEDSSVVKVEELRIEKLSEAAQEELNLVDGERVVIIRKM